MTTTTTSLPSLISCRPERHITPFTSYTSGSMRRHSDVTLDVDIGHPRCSRQPRRIAITQQSPRMTLINKVNDPIKRD
jgi:hypothetical protein